MLAKTMLRLGLHLSLACLALSSASEAAEPFDLVLRGGKVVDGSGAPWYAADVAIRDGKIVRIGRISEAELKSAKRSLDCTGLIVAPGFIDMMGQTATPMMDDPQSALNLLTQGITTINAGEGQSAAPLDEATAGRLGWRTMAEYFQLLDMRGLPVNVVQTVGHSQIRQIVLGDSDAKPSEEQLRQMQALVREAMQAGAIGVSTALIYPPATYADTREIAALCSVAGEYGGRYYTHMRNEGDKLLEAIDEALEIGCAAGTPVHIFHLKTAGRRNWPKMEQAIAKIKAARAAGQQVTADVYPYVNNGLGIEAFIHPRHFAAGRQKLIDRLDDAGLRAEIRQEMEEQGGWENWYRHVGGDWSKVIIGQINDEEFSALAGRSLAEIAKARGQDEWEMFFHLVKRGAFALPQSMSEANKIKAMREKFVSFCTDVGPAGGSSIASHPRAFGAFPRLLSRYVRELGVMSLERAVAQASAAAANNVLAYDRGRISEGLAADIAVFDYESIADQATFAEPRRLSTGVKHVIVNGELVLDDGKLTAARPGRVLRGPGYDREQAPHAVRSGKADPRMGSFDRLMAGFMQRHCVPGAALAVTDRGKLVFARGYGYADIAAGEPATPDSLFRIASISKPITAVAILQLVEQGKLKFDDKVWDVLDIAALQEPSAQGGSGSGPTFADDRQREITIRHLLEHRGGWDRDKSFDAMFQSVRFAESLGATPPAGPREVMRCMLGEQLDFPPGERYAYSNYGYCLLGRAIEKLSGQSYEDYVREHVLLPIGIHDMRLGRTRLAGRHAGEVRYYDPARGPSVFADDLGQETPHPYGAWNLEAMDAHGGWLASAVDLARFAAAFDDPARCKLLKAETIDLMHARPPGLAGHDKDGKPLDVYYSLGWINRDVADGKTNHWHTGSLPGTATILIRRHDGKNFVCLFNARVSPHVEHLTREIDPLLHAAADDVREWPGEEGL